MKTKTIECYYGSKVVDENGNVLEYQSGGTTNGYCFKDYEAYKSGNGICYLGESSFEFINDEMEEVESLLIEGKITQEEYHKKYREICELNGYTRKDILSLTENNETVADIVFDAIDWQCPESYYYEGDFDDFTE